MGVLFGILILALLTVALYNRRKQNKNWVAEERYDESGAWMDKRAGERGTYGSLDALRETERQSLGRQSRIADAALDMRNYAFEHIPGFHERSDAQIRAFTSSAKALMTRFFDTIDGLKNGQPLQTPDAPPAEDPHSNALKKIMLAAAYAQFPWLLDQEIEVLKRLDLVAGQLAVGMLAS